VSFVFQEKTTNKQNVKNLAVLAVLLCLLLSALLSETFVLSHTGHVHDNDGAGGSCAVCVQIQNAENFLKLFKTAVSSISLSLFVFLATALIYCGGFFPLAFKTPVQLKSRMNN
jgi:hypothetical protein